ncbi:MAG: hypothetical protein ACRDZX_01300 [Acidimicrobiales bacterium]
MGGDQPAGRLQAGRRAVAEDLVARVVPDVAGFDRDLDYLVPRAMAGPLHEGSLVQIPLQGRKVRGWVSAYPVDPPATVSLRALVKVLGWGPEPELFALARWAAWRWASRRRWLLVTASAKTLVRELPPPRWLPAGGQLPAAGAHRAGPGAGRSAGHRSAAVRELVSQAWRPGPQVLRVPPAWPAMDVVLAAAERGPVLVVTPTTSRAEAGCAALHNLGVPVALLPGAWAQARAGAQVVIGARAAVWGPCPGLVSVVVLDAHDESLVQQQAPTWDAATVAAERARRAHAPCLWLTPCPTLELLEAADGVHLLSRSDERAGWAPVRAVDRRREDPRSGLYSPALVRALREERRVVCVLNRKGRAVLLDCSACGELATCEHCGGPVAQEANELSCRRCYASRPVVCASCGSDALRLLKLGVSRVREQLEALAGRRAGEVAGGDGPLPDTPVLVGTEAVLYRDADLRRRGGVDVVAFLDFDQELLAPRYRAGEEALALLARASRLLGARPGGGQVLVQTRAPSHPVISAVVLADPGRLARSERPVRQALELPPFGAVAVVAGPGADELARRLTGQATGGGADDGGTRTGRDPGLEGNLGLHLVRVNEGRWVVRAPDNATLADALSAAGRPTARVRIEVGPVRL